MTDPTTRARHARQRRVMLAEPEGGWSRDVYDRELSAYVAERGRPPQTVTMHPGTAATLGLSDALVAATAAYDEPLVVTSSDYPQQTITLYY